MATDQFAKAATAALIQVQDGKRWCACCRKLKPAAGFKSRRGNRCGVIRCGDCAERTAAAKKAEVRA